ncbi:type II secretion system F family protein [Longispora sp. NPDC051575]|uniref:type II secretion system F family protein n=1 Tax=Longispora sp. NPDC051575 TaxID=3154943 RepID=UPI003445A6BC
MDAILLGAGVGMGLVLIVFGLWPARPPLLTAIANIYRTPSAPASRRRRIEEALASPLTRFGLPRRATMADLAVCERDPIAYLGSLAGLAVMALLAPAATVAVMNLMGAGIALTVPIWLGVALAAVAVWITEASLKGKAEQRRLLMRHTLAALLDIVPPALAAGAGVEQALMDSTRISSGWAARRIRHALATARTTRTPLWQALGDLGRETGVVQLEQLAATLQLASGEGTRIRAALTQRGHALSERLAAELEARAESASERMSIPLMLLTSVFLLFLIYPGIAGLQP